MKIKDLLLVLDKESRIFVSHEDKTAIYTFSALRKVTPLHERYVTNLKPYDLDKISIRIDRIPVGLLFVDGEWVIEEEYELCPICMTYHKVEDMVQARFDNECRICEDCKGDGN